MSQKTVDLAAHMNQEVERHAAADFPVALRPLTYRTNGAYVTVPGRLAVVREDTGVPLAVVSERYSLLPHGRILSAVENATAQLDVGPVPRGVYVDRKGARMRAIFKFPSLAQPVLNGDDICPCVKIQNTYDATSRVRVHIGAFRFVCTNLAVGGGGVFAGGFMAVHSGEIPVEEITKQLGSYLASFDRIAWTYRVWAETPVEEDGLGDILASLPKRTASGIQDRLSHSPDRSVYGAYNAATWYATHRMRSYRSAFKLLGHLNREFQERFPPSRN